MTTNHMDSGATNAHHEASDILRYARERADTGDLMMSVIADHIENIEKQLVEYRALIRGKLNAQGH